MSEQLPRTRKTLLERYLSGDVTQLSDRAQKEIDAGIREDPIWYYGPTGIRTEDILDAPKAEVDELQEFLSQNSEAL